MREGYILNSKNPMGFIKIAILQFLCKDMTQILNQANRFMTLGVSRINSDKVSMRMALVHGSCMKNYFLKRRFMNGWPSIIILLDNFESTFNRYLKTPEMKNGYKWREPS